MVKLCAKPPAPVNISAQNTHTAIFISGEKEKTEKKPNNWGSCSGSGIDKIGRYAMRVLWVVSQVLDISVCFHSEESLFPASDPQFACIVLVNTGDISFLDGVS